MASNINPYNIDGTFPVAGQDNPSQGFRDNFTNIKNNFIFAQNEIDDLQAKAIVASALNGQTVTNDMSGTQITRPQLRAWTQALLDHQFVAGNLTLDFNLANFHKFTTSGNVVLSFTNWPATSGSNGIGYGVMRVWIYVADITHTIQIPASVTVGINEIAGYNATNQTISFDAVGDYVLDFSSIDGGNNYLIFDITRNHSTLRDPSLYFNSTVNPALYVGFNSNSLPIAQNIESTDDAITFHGGINGFSAASLNLTSADNPSASDGTGEVAGYHIYSARGNLDQGNVQAVHSGDYLGYVSARGLTGNGTANTYQTTSSIQFYASGNNLVNGTGGNIALFVKANGVSTLSQAVSVNQDKSVDILGSFRTSGNIVENGTAVITFTGVGPNNFTANASLSTVIITSASYATISTANIILPSTPTNNQVFRISAVCPITTANVYAGAAAVAWVPSNKFSSGNVAVKLTYQSGNSTWYLS